MEYRSREIPEGINTSKEHPLKEFLILIFGLGALLAVILFILSLAAEYLAEYVPFSAEQRIAEIYQESVPAIEKQDPNARFIQAYLQKLANQLAIAEELGDEMTITVHYVDDDMVNAFATLGGHVVMFRGLLEKIPDENTLAMVMAHEIAHIKHRHPIKALGRAVVVGIAIGLISTNMGDSMTGRILGDAGLLTTLQFSRAQETQSDITAMRALANHYGHVSGADRLFEIFIEQNGKTNITTPEFLSTHPLSQQRIQNVHSHAVQAGWQLEAKVTPLPPDFKSWLTSSENNPQADTKRSGEK